MHTYYRTVTTETQNMMKEIMNETTKNMKRIV